MSDDITSIRVFCLSTFDEDELETIKGFLVGDEEGVDLEMNFWEEDEDASDAEIVNLYKKASDPTMIFVDRIGLDDNSYLVADGRCFYEEWFIQTVVENYGYTYSEAWGQDEKAIEIMAGAAVPYARINALAKIDILDLWTNYQENEEYSLTDYLDVGDITVSFTDDTDDVVAALGDLNIGERDADGEEETEENEEEEEEAGEEAEEEEEEAGRKRK